MGSADVPGHSAAPHGRDGREWCYVRRAIDRSGTLADVLFSGMRDMAATRAFFQSAEA